VIRIKAVVLLRALLKPERAVQKIRRRILDESEQDVERDFNLVKGALRKFSKKGKENFPFPAGRF
jgi:hypothetical protein